MLNSVVNAHGHLFLLKQFMDKFMVNIAYINMMHLIHLCLIKLLH